MFSKIRVRRPAPGTALAGLALIAATSGVAAGAIPGSDGSVTACVNSKGAIAAVDAETGRTCSKGETLIRLAATDAAGKVANAAALDGKHAADFAPVTASRTFSGVLDATDTVRNIGGQPITFICNMTSQITRAELDDWVTGDAADVLANQDGQTHRLGPGVPLEVLRSVTPSGSPAEAIYRQTSFSIRYSQGDVLNGIASVGVNVGGHRCVYSFTLFA